MFGEIFIILLVLRTRGIINISPNTRAIFEISTFAFSLLVPGPALEHMSHDLGAVTIFRFSELGLELGLGQD